MKSFRAFFALIAVFLLALALWYVLGIRSDLNKSMITDDQVLIIEVKPGSTANDLLDRLFEKKLIASKSIYLHLIKFEKLAHRLKAGIYEIKPGETARDFIHRVVDGDVLTLSFRIIEGNNLRQVEENLREAPYLRLAENDWLSIKNEHLSPEGLLLADTYYYKAGSDAKQLLEMANKNLLRCLEDSWEKRDPDLPYKTPYEMLVAASIIEKETSIADERALISGVIVNRLRRHMRLQMDPTVIYALGADYTGKLFHEDLSVNSPYNTYRYTGLPPTPIAMVGKETIVAAAHPFKSNYLYFVAKGDGSHVFSVTYEGQKKAILNYQHKELNDN